MRCARPILLGVPLLAVMLGSGILVAHHTGSASGPVYSVAQVTAGLQYQPIRWVGHTVHMRGVLWDYGILGGGVGGGFTAQGAVLIEAWPVAPHALQYSFTPTGQYQFNTPSTEPVLLIRGTVPLPRPSVGINGMFDFLQRIAQWSGHSDLLVSSGRQSHVYRILLIAPGHCPPVVASPCLSGVLH